MYTQCTTERTIQQQRSFEQCLLEMMEKYTYDEISVSSLCERSGLSRKIFYRLFGCKDDVLYAMIDHTLTDYAKYSLAAGEYTADAPMELQRFFSFWYQHRRLLEVLSANHQSTLLLERTGRHLQQEEFNVLHMIGADSQHDGMETLVFFLSGIMGLLIFWHQSGYEKSIEEISAIANRLLTTSLVRMK